MLLEIEAKIGDVVTIKLTSGEELIATLLEDNTNFVKVGKPRVLVNSVNGLATAPYLLTCEPSKSVKINRATIVVLELTEKESANQYITTTTSIIL